MIHHVLCGSVILLACSAAQLIAAEPAATKTSTTAAGKRPIFIYVSLADEGQIAIYRMDRQTGALTAASRCEVGPTPGALAVAPSRRWMYASLRRIASVAALQIDPATGGLTLAGTTPIVADAAYLGIDRRGKFLFMVSYTGNKAGVYPIEPSGKIGSQATSILATGKNPHAIQIDPDNRFVYVPNCGADKILHYEVSGTSGVLTPADPGETPTVAGAGPRHFFFHPTLPHVYFVNEKNSSVTVYDRDATNGKLTAVQSVPTLPADFSGRNTCAHIEVHPSGQFLYASNRGHDSIACFRVAGAKSSTPGQLTTIGQVATEKTPRSFQIDPTGQFLFAAGQASHQLASYRIDPSTGELTQLATYAVGKNPAWVMAIEMPEN